MRRIKNLQLTLSKHLNPWPLSLSHLKSGYSEGKIAIVLILLFFLFFRFKGVYEKINRTTSADWSERHPFKDRHNIALFTSYAKDRQCGFKIGRITFNTSLAWLSFFFGLTGLLFHFF